MAKGGRKTTKTKVVLTYCRCEDAEGTCDDLISESHSHLAPDNIRVYPKSTDIRDRGKKVPCAVSKISGFGAFLAQGLGVEGSGRPFFAILINAQWWIDAPENKQRAILDQALCQCGKDDRGNLYIKAPDAVVYRGAVIRNGLYSDDLRMVAKDVKPMHLELIEGESLEERGIPDCGPGEGLEGEAA